MEVEEREIGRDGAGRDIFVRREGGAGMEVWAWKRSVFMREEKTERDD